MNIHSGPQMPWMYNNKYRNIYIIYIYIEIFFDIYLHDPYVLCFTEGLATSLIFLFQMILLVLHAFQPV